MATCLGVDTAERIKLEMMVVHPWLAEEVELAPNLGSPHDLVQALDFPGSAPVCTSPAELIAAPGRVSSLHSIGAWATTKAGAPLAPRHITIKPRTGRTGQRVSGKGPALLAHSRN